jgi:hypothetical protein
MKKIVQLSANLPADPGLAIVEFARRVEKALKTHKVWTDDDLLATLLFFEKFFGQFKLGTVVNFATDMALRRRVEFYTNRIKAQRATILSKSVEAEVDELLQTYVDMREENTFGLAKLNAEEKKKILSHLEKIRTIIEASTLPDRKKNALFERLARLVREVNLHGTMTDRFFAFAGDLGFVLGDMTKKAKPLLDEIKEVLRIVGRSRARQEGVSLPSGDDVLRLPDSGE